MEIFSVFSFFEKYHHFFIDRLQILQGVSHAEKLLPSLGMSITSM